MSVAVRDPTATTSPLPLAGRADLRPRHHQYGQLHNVALLIALTLLVLYVAFYAQHALSLITYPYGIDQGEGYDTWSAWQIDQGRLPYTGNQAPSFYSSNYPP